MRFPARGAAALLSLAVAASAQIMQDAGRGAYDVADPGTGNWALQSGKASLVPHVQASWSHDDNLFIAPTEKVADNAWTVTPGVSAAYGGRGHNHVYAAYAVDVVRYEERTEENYQNHAAGVGARIRSGRSFLDTRYDFVRSEGASREIGDRLQRDSQTGEALVESRVAPKTSLGVNYRRIENQYESRAFLDDTDQRVGMRVVFHATPETDVLGEVAHGWVDLHDPKASFADATYWEADVGVRRVLSARTSGQAWLGYQERTFDGDVADVGNWVANANVDTRVAEHVTVGIQAYGSLRPALERAGETIHSYGVRPSIRSRLLTERLYGTASVEVGRYDQILPDGTDGRQDTYYGAQFGLDWRVVKRVTAGADVNYTENDSDDENFSFDRTQVSVRVAVNL